MLAILNEIPFFIFSRAETLSTGAILILIWWVAEVNDTFELYSDEELKEIAIEIIKSCNKLKIKI